MDQYEHVHSEPTPVGTFCTHEHIQVMVSTADLQLVLYPDSSKDFYRFTCPSCDRIVRSALPDFMARNLLHWGVTAVNAAEWPPEALEAKTGAPLTEDEFLDFVVALEATESATEPVHSPSLP